MPTRDSARPSTPRRAPTAPSARSASPARRRVLRPLASSRSIRCSSAGPTPVPAPQLSAPPAITATPGRWPPYVVRPADGPRRAPAPQRGTILAAARLHEGPVCRRSGVSERTAARSARPGDRARRRSAPRALRRDRSCQRACRRAVADARYPPVELRPDGWFLPRRSSAGSRPPDPSAWADAVAVLLSTARPRRRGLRANRCSSNST